MRGDFWTAVHSEDKPLLLPHYCIKDSKLIYIGKDEIDIPTDELNLIKECNGNNTVLQLCHDDQAQYEIIKLTLQKYIRQGVVVLEPGLPSNHKSKRQKSVMIISPHPDDAVLACGGILAKLLLRRLAIDIMIVNIFSKENFSIISRLRRDPKLAENIIRLEEKTVEKLLGCKTLNLDFPDGLLRGYKRLSQLFIKDDLKSLGDGEKDVIRRVECKLREIVSSEKVDFIIAPIGIGGHVDHLIARDAVINVISSFQKKYNLFLYEDQPYTAINTNYMDWIHNVEFKRSCKMRPIYVDITESVRLKRHFMSVYRSQLMQQQIEAIINYSEQIETHDSQYNERIWRV